MNTTDKKKKISENLLNWIETTPKMSQAEVGRRCGIKRSGMQTWWKNGVPEEHWQKVADIMGATIEELTGENQIQTGAVSSWMDEDNVPDFIVKIPRLDIKVSAGDGCSVWYPDEKKPLMFQASWLIEKRLSTEHLIVMTVHGDSMSPEVKDGDVVLIDRTQNERIIDGEIYAILCGEDIKLKYLNKQLDGSIRVSSENSAKYPDEIITSDIDCFQIIGRKVWRGG